MTNKNIGGLKNLELYINTLFTKDRYIIPIYQRNYDWGEAEITQLIQDIIECLKERTGLLPRNACGKEA